MFALLTQCLSEKIFARQHSGIQHWGLSECEPCTLFPLLQSIHRASPEHTPLPYSPLPSTPDTHRRYTHTQTCSTHGCMRAHSHTRMQQQGEREATWWKDTSTQTAFAYAGRGPFIQRDNVCVDFFFVCTFLSTKSSRKNGGEKKKSERHAIVATDMFRLIQALHSYLNPKQFSIQQSCSRVGVSHCVFDEDIFERLTSLSLTCHLSHTRGISLFSDDDDDVLAELSKSADEADKRWRQAAVCAHQLNLALVCHYRNNAAIITSMNWQTISWICLADLEKKPLSGPCTPQQAEVWWNISANIKNLPPQLSVDYSRMSALSRL